MSWRIEVVIKRTLYEITLMNGMPASALVGNHTNLYLNLTQVPIGGPLGDTGVSGRMSITDTQVFVRIDNLCLDTADDVRVNKEGTGCGHHITPQGCSRDSDQGRTDQG